MHAVRDLGGVHLRDLAVCPLQDLLEGHAFLHEQIEFHLLCQVGLAEQVDYHMLQGMSPALLRDLALVVGGDVVLQLF